MWRGNTTDETRTPLIDESHVGEGTSLRDSSVEMGRPVSDGPASSSSIRCDTTQAHSTGMKVVYCPSCQRKTPVSAGVTEFFCECGVAIRAAGDRETVSINCPHCTTTNLVDTSMTYQPRNIATMCGSCHAMFHHPNQPDFDSTGSLPPPPAHVDSPCRMTEVLCPTCGTKNQVSTEFVSLPRDYAVKCGACTTMFHLPQQPPASGCAAFGDAKVVQ